MARLTPKKIRVKAKKTAAKAKPAGKIKSNKPAKAKPASKGRGY